ncbi:MAG TPA: alpha/beta hydrolase [Gemmatimonadales bacterium]|nr:alpha/beta hydrolase [Gemmatimonadales bacterium]
MTARPPGRPTAFLSAAGHRLEYRWIEPARPGLASLVFLHEALGSLALWRDFPDRVAERTGCGALAYSRHGLGRSDPLAELRPDDYLEREAREALPRVLAARGIENPILIGHSDGATIALIHAAEGRWPVRGLVLEAPHVMVEDVTIRGVEQARAAYRSGSWREKLAPHHRDVDATFAGWADVWLRPSFRSWSIVPRLPLVTCPVLLIQGDSDRYGTVAQVETIRDGVCGPVEMLVLPECGHAPHVQRAGEVLDAVVGFVGRFATGSTDARNSR